MLNKHDFENAKSTYVAELSHSQTLIQLSGNPQGGSDAGTSTRTSKQKTTFHFGSYLDVSKGEATQASEITQEVDNQTMSELRDTVKSLKESQLKIEQNLVSTVNNAVDNKIQPLKQEMENIKKANETGLGAVLKQLGEIRANQRTEIASAVTAAMTAFMKTPSGRVELPPGGGGNDFSKAKG